MFVIPYLEQRLSRGENGAQDGFGLVGQIRQQILNGATQVGLDQQPICLC